MASGSVGNPATPQSLGVSTRRNDIRYVVISSPAPFWFDDFNYDYYGNVDPYAILNGPYNGFVGQPVTFDASASYDPDGDSLTYQWSFDGGVTWTEPTSEAVYEMTWNELFEGSVSLKVIAWEDGDKEGGTDTTTALVSISSADYSNHGQYVKSVAQETESGPGKGASVSSAARSDTGKKAK